MSSDHCGGKTLGSLFLLISFLQKWLRLRLVRMCVIAQTPLISPFGSIGFRERERERWEERGERREEERLPETKTRQGGAHFHEVRKNKHKMWNLS